MICARCRKANLPGGVRCSYCGTPFTPSLDFDLGADAAPRFELPPAAVTAPPEPVTEPIELRLSPRELWREFSKPGLLWTSAISFVIFIGTGGYIVGTELALGYAVSVLIHELGHVAVAWWRRLPVTPPFFLPFAGAFVSLRSLPDDPVVHAEIGAGGPAAGFLAALACAGIGAATGDFYWLELAALGFGLNLANLLPVAPLDGSRIVEAFSPRIWDAALVAMLAWVIRFPSPLLWLVFVVLGAFRLATSAEGRHNLAPFGSRARMGIVYVALCAGLATGFEAVGGLANVQRATQHPPQLKESGLHPAPSNDDAGTAVAATRPHDVRLRPAALAAAQANPEALWLANARFWAVRGLLWGIGTLGWLLVVVLLSWAADVPVSARRLGLPGVLSVVLLVQIVASRWVSEVDPGPLLQATHFVALCFALAFAVVQAVRREGPGGPGTRPLYSWLIHRALGWAAGGLLLVAYWSLSPWPALVLLIAIAVVWGARPRLPLALLGRLCEEGGTLSPAVAYRSRALARCDDPEEAADLRLAIARCHLAAERGGPSVAVLEPLRLTPPAPPLLDAEVRSVRAGALIRLGRWDDALAECEMLLHGGRGDRSDHWRPLLVNARLAEAALFRGWPDETSARAETFLKSLPARSGELGRVTAGAVHRLRAAALVETNLLSEAAGELRLAALKDGAPAAEAGAALVRAQLFRRQGLRALAAASVGLALRRLPDSLAVRYWRGLLLREEGSPEGEKLLQVLAAGHPDEYWGRRARVALGTPGE
jgi:Zn-dependent protease